MTELEKVIRALENCTDEIKCRDCPWETCETFCLSVKVPLDLAKAALYLLKAQEPVKPIMRREMDDICSFIDNVAYCGKCGAPIGRLKQNYCSECGQAVKWDG